MLLLLSRLQARVPDELGPSTARRPGLGPREPRRRAPDRDRAASRGARRSGSRERAGRAVRPLAQRSGLDVSCQDRPNRSRISRPTTELVIYRVAQEALTNVARHSGSESGRARVCGRRTARLVLTVRDHGRGLPTDQAPGSGMRGMRERAGLVEAALEIDNATPGPGAEVRLHVPIGGRRVIPLKTRIMLADDHAVVRRGLRMVLEAQPDWRWSRRSGTAARRSSAGSRTTSTWP